MPDISLYEPLCQALDIQISELLIVVGIIITITLTKMLAVTNAQMIITSIGGCFVWGFGLMLRIKIRKTLIALGIGTRNLRRKITDLSKRS